LPAESNMKPCCLDGCQVAKEARLGSGGETWEPDLSTVRCAAIRADGFQSEGDAKNNVLDGLFRYMSGVVQATGQVVVQTARASAPGNTRSMTVALGSSGIGMPSSAQISKILSAACAANATRSRSQAAGL
jgi:hypothetical protein